MAAPRVTPGRRGRFPGRERTGGRAGDAQDPPGGVPGRDRTFAVLRVVGGGGGGLFGSSLAGVSGCWLMVPGRVLARVPGLRRPAGGARSSSSPRRTSARAALSAGGVRSALRAFRARPCANESRRSRVLVARCLRVRASASAWVLLRSIGPAVPRRWSARRAPSACGARGAGECMPLRRCASSVPRGRT